MAHVLDFYWNKNSEKSFCRKVETEKLQNTRDSTNKIQMHEVHTHSTLSNSTKNENSKKN